MIRSLQSLRGLAALAVVFYHLDLALPNGVHTDFGAVSVFFVLSGFLMALTTERSAEDFLAKRFLRIAPAYWAITLLSALWYGLGLANPPVTAPVLWDRLLHAPLSIPALFANDLRGFLDARQARVLCESVLFFPKTSDALPFVGVGWTLNLEVLCYIAFAISLAAWKRWAPALCILIVMFACWLVEAAYPGNRFAHMNTSYPPYFCAGLGVFYLWRFGMARWTPPPWAWWSAVALLLAYYVLFFLQDMPRLILIGGPVAAVLAGLCIERSGFAGIASPLQWLGAISFSLYLTHAQVIDTVRTLFAAAPWLDWKSSPLAAVLIIALCLLVAWAAYVLIERPLVQWGHWLLQRRRASRVVAPVSATAGAAAVD